MAKKRAVQRLYNTSTALIIRIAYGTYVAREQCSPRPTCKSEPEADRYGNIKPSVHDDENQNPKTNAP